MSSLTQQSSLHTDSATNPKVMELVQGVGALITLPDVFVRINQLVSDPDSRMADIAKVAAQDPSFTIRLLRVANSSFYGFSSTVDTVAKAVSIIGTSQIRNLALATSVASSFKGLPNTLVSMEDFWRHSLYCGLVARILVKRVGGCDADAVFTSGLLHDIGELVIFNRMPQQAKNVLMMVLDSGDEVPIHQAERQVMDFDHAQVGGELARQWKLPPFLVECIEYHHNILAAQLFPREVALVHIANVLALMAEIRTFNPDDVTPLDEQAWKVIGLNDGEVDELMRTSIEEVQEEFAEAEQLFLGR